MLRDVVQHLRRLVQLLTMAIDWSQAPFGQGISDAEIARRLGCSREAVGRARKALGKPSPRKKMAKKSRVKTGRRRLAGHHRTAISLDPAAVALVAAFEDQYAAREIRVALERLVGRLEAGESIPPAPVAPGGVHVMALLLPLELLVRARAVRLAGTDPDRPASISALVRTALAEASMARAEISEAAFEARLGLDELEQRAVEMVVRGADVAVDRAIARFYLGTDPEKA